ncbi:MAG: PVC-type heme-binding CxxCH protein, partial [Verrucomicrobiales bacterium]
MTFRAILVLFAVLFLAASGSAQRDLKDIPNPDPEVERTSFQLADGLEANLFASEPMIRKPIQMAWDQRGRLWVASSETYPQIRPGDPSDDKIVVLEDTDGDGKADKSTVFADNLLIPTGVLPADGGCYVANSTQMLFLRDSDGDGKADQRKILLSGFGTEDTHHILHTFRQGPDGMVYFAQSVYIHTHAETPFGVRRMGGGGFWHFRPESGQLEVYTRGQVNPWGLVFDRWGQSFTTDGAYSEGVNYAFPGAAYFWAKEADDWTKDFPRILKGLSPGQPKHCGIEIISGRHFPESWSGSMVAPDFRGNRINRFLISDAGSGYAAKQVEDVIKTTHRAFRPVDVNLGPDGALYVADWYNPIIQHGEVDFRDERRDHTHGRIWRIAMKDRPLVPKPKIAGATDDELLEMLEASEDWTRAMVRRELRERARASESRRESISRTLTTWLARLSQDASDTERCVLEAMWAAQSAQLWQVNSSLAKELERSTEPKVRAAALRSYYHNHVTASGAFKLIALSIEEKLASQSADPSGVSGFDPFISDPHPRVRLEAIHCLRALQTPQATEIALRALDKEMDENLDFALWLTCRETQDVWLPAFQKGEINFGGNTAHAVFALKATGNPAALAPLVSALREDKISDKDRPQVLQLIASMGGPAELGLLLDVAGGVPSTSQKRPPT